MLTTEQTKHFNHLFKKAALIVAGTNSRAWHIRVSGRQLASGACCVGFIFGVKGKSDWMKIADVPAELLTEAKKDYRKLLADALPK